MSQQIMDMIARMGGADAVAAMAARVGISPEQAQGAVAALLPAVTGGMAQQAQAGNGALVDRLSGLAAAFTGSAASDDAVAQGNDILGGVFGSKDVSRAVAQKAAGQTGLDIGSLKALLPMVATMAASALGNGTAAPASANDQGGIGGMLGGNATPVVATPAGATGQAAGGPAGALLGMLDANKDGNPFDDILGMAKGFLNR